MSINRLNNTWKKRIRELAPELRKTQNIGLVNLIVGIYQSKSVMLSRIAMKIPGKARLLSTVKRISRLLLNNAIDPKKIYAPVAKEWLAAQAKSTEEIRLAIDGTKVGYGHQLLMVSITYRKRSIPICWTWVAHVKGHSKVEKQIELLTEVKKLIPPDTEVLLVGDSEFGTMGLIKELKKWQWRFSLREKSHVKIRLNGQSEWIKLSDVEIKKGQTLWLEAAYLSESKSQLVSICVYWKRNEDAPWFLATNLPTPHATKKAYGRRMWIEEMFGDMKKNGFDLERTMLRHTDRLSCITLAVALLYVWLISVGGKTIKSGQRSLVDRNDRRDLSIFNIGLRFIERQLTNECSFSVVFCLFY